MFVVMATLFLVVGCVWVCFLVDGCLWFSGLGVLRMIGWLVACGWLFRAYFGLVTLLLFGCLPRAVVSWLLVAVVNFVWVFGLVTRVLVLL